MHLILERPGIDRLTAEPHRISRRGCDQDARGGTGRTARLQRAAQMGDIRLHCGERFGRGLIGIQVFDEPVGGDDLAVRCDQPRQHAPLPRPADVGRGAVDGDLERAEHPNPDHWHLADEGISPTLTVPATGPQVSRKSVTSAPVHAQDMATTPPFALRTRTSTETTTAIVELAGVQKTYRSAGGRRGG